MVILAFWKGFDNLLTKTYIGVTYVICTMFSAISWYSVDSFNTINWR